MKNFPNKKVVFLIIVVALFSFLTLTLMIASFDSPVSVISHEKYLEDDNVELKELKTPKSSGFWILNNITIDDAAPYVYGSVTWQAANITYGWCNGKGTLAEPYVIENVTINAGSSPTKSGILIRDSNDIYFVIRNCTIFNPLWSNYPDDISGCVKMINASNGQIYSNNFYSNTGNDDYKAGISLYQCAKISIANNTINGNGLISGNSYGIFMRYSNESLVFNNSANSNYRVGIFLQEECHYNNITMNKASYNGNFSIALYTRSSNNEIANNTANHNDVYGIYLVDNCNNNTITGNNASDNLQHGIWLSTNCNYNTIMGNNASSNKHFGIYIYIYK